jgi:uncharacterized protein YqgC (DUF456 family)
MDKVFGLPAHPLLVHLPIIAIPFLAIMVAVYVVKNDWRSALRIPVGALAVLTGLGTALAASAGESLQSEVQSTNQVRAHADLGGQTEAIVLVAAGIIVAYLALDWWQSRQVRQGASVPARLHTAMIALGIAAIVAGSVATVWDVRTGHTGAKATWSTLEQTQNTAAQSGR